jgi:DHA1 family bicyclomycin/chloramphenicol resistance-like MFS transporter
MLAPSIGVLLAARALQALGACAAPVLGRAIVRDIAEPAQAAVILSYIGMAMAVAPAVGPLLGGYLEVAFGWRASFAALMVLGIAVAALVWRWLPETNRYRDPAATQPRRLLANYRALLANPVYRGFVAIIALSFAGLFSFISGVSFVLIEGVGLSPDAFGLSFAAVVLGYLLGNFLSTRITRRLGIDRMLGIGLALTVAGGGPMAALAVTGVTGALPVVLPMMVFMAGMGIILPNGLAGAVGPFPAMAGSASALLGFIQMGSAALVGALVGHLHDGTARPMALAIAATALAASVAYVGLLRARRQEAAALARAPAE